MYNIPLQRKNPDIPATTRTLNSKYRQRCLLWSLFLVVFVNFQGVRVCLGTGAHEKAFKGFSKEKPKKEKQPFLLLPCCRAPELCLWQTRSLTVGCHTMASRWMCSERRGKTWSKLGKEKSGPPLADFPGRWAAQGERRSGVGALCCGALEPKQACRGNCVPSSRPVGAGKGGWAEREAGSSREVGSRAGG